MIHLVTFYNINKGIYVLNDLIDCLLGLHTSLLIFIPVWKNIYVHVLNILVFIVENDAFVVCSKDYMSCIT